MASVGRVVAAGRGQLAGPRRQPLPRFRVGCGRGAGRGLCGGGDVQRLVVDAVPAAVFGPPGGAAGRGRVDAQVLVLLAVAVGDVGIGGQAAEGGALALPDHSGVLQACMSRPRVLITSGLAASALIIRMFAIRLLLRGGVAGLRAGQRAADAGPQGGVQFIAAGQHQQVGIGHAEQADAAPAHGLPQADAVFAMTQWLGIAGTHIPACQWR